MIPGIAIVISVLSLALAAWAFVEYLRHRPPGRPLFVGLAVVGALVLVQAVIAAVGLLGGDGPSGEGPTVTLVGYLLTALLLPPAGAVLARMEPTRWGSALIASAAVIVPVLMLRLWQIWNG